MGDKKSTLYNGLSKGSFAIANHILAKKELYRILLSIKLKQKSFLKYIYLKIKWKQD